MSVIRENGTIDFEALKEKIDSDYKASKDRVSSGRKLPQIVLDGTGQVVSEPEKKSQVIIYDGPAIKVSDKISDQQIDFSGKTLGIKGVIAEISEDIKENTIDKITNKLVLIGAGIILLLIVTR